MKKSRVELLFQNGESSSYEKNVMSDHDAKLFADDRIILHGFSGEFIEKVRVIIDGRQIDYN